MTWAPDYVTTSDLKSFLRIQDSDDDAQLALVIAAASRAIDRETNRQFGLVDAPEARYYTPTWDTTTRRFVVEIDDVVVVTGVSVAVDDGSSYTWSTTVTGYDFVPRNALVKGRPYTQLIVRPTSAQPIMGVDDGIKITARWGWSSVPTTIAEACLLQSSRLMARRDAPFGVAGSPDQGSELRLLDRLDPDVAEMIRAYYRWWGAR